MMRDRRSGERRYSLRSGPERRRLEGALAKVGMLRDAIKGFVSKHGEDSIVYFDRVAAEWYGPLEQRAALLDACRSDPALDEARRIVHAAGFHAAPLVTYVVRHYFGKPAIDRRA